MQLMRAQTTRGTAVVRCVTSRSVRSVASHRRGAAASGSRTTARSSPCQARVRCATWPLAHPELVDMAAHHSQSAAGPRPRRLGVPTRTQRATEMLTLRSGKHHTFDAASVGMISDRDGAQTLIIAAHTHPDEVLLCQRFPSVVWSAQALVAGEVDAKCSPKTQRSRAVPADSSQVNESGHLTTIDHGTRLYLPPSFEASFWLLARRFPLPWPDLR